jgi:tetratricopeptide (TPR) repeat protein
MNQRSPSAAPQKNKPKTYPVWLGFAQRELTDRGSMRIRIRWTRVLVLLLVMGILAWTGKTVGLYYFFREIREFKEVSFVDMIAFPINRGSVRVQQGDYQVEQGKAALEREDYRRGFSLLREGVARSKANLEGRKLLAQIYAGWRPDLAADILREGVEYGKEDVDFMRMMVMLMLREKQDDDLLKLTAELKREELPEAVERILAVGRLRAAMNNGRFDIAKEVFDTSNIASTLDGLLLGTELYMRTDREEEATEVLLSVINARPDGNLEPIYSKLVTVYKARGMYDEAREVALELTIRNPLEWRPRIRLIDVLSSSGRIERRDREINALLQRHRNDEQAMIALAQLAATYGNVAAASRLYELALENGYDLSLFSLTLAEALVAAGEYQRAVDLCNELVEEDPGWLINSAVTFNGIRSLAYYGIGDRELGNLYLRNFLDAEGATMTVLFEVAKKFREFGLPEKAMVILEEAYRRDNRNEVILSQLIDVEMELGAFFAVDQHLKQLFKLRRPNYDLLEDIHDRLRSDRFLFTRERRELLENLEAVIAEQQEMSWDIWRRIEEADKQES